MGSMKLALFSDIHANLQALQACMAHARAQGATQMAFLGDMLGYGGSPAAVLDTIMHAVQEGAWIVRGNHDDLALHPPSDILHMGEQGAQWTHAQLAPCTCSFWSSCPCSASTAVCCWYTPAPTSPNAGPTLKTASWPSAA